MQDNIKNSKFSINNIIQVSLLLASVILSIYFYQIFPAVVPTHWGVSGEVNGWGPRWLGAFLLPAILFAIYFLFGLLPKIDPKRANYEDFKKAFNVFKTAIMSVLFAVYIIASLNAVGVMVSVAFWTPVFIGMLFIVIGNYFGKIRNNYFVGIRTPWTLSSEEVWNKTHRLGGKLFVIGGLAMMLMGFVPIALRMPLLIAVIFVIAVVPIVYSYLLYKKQK